MLVRDLMFASRVGVEARRAGVVVQVIREPADLEGKEGRLLVVDLHQPGAIEAAAAWRGRTGGEAVGFFSHVDTETAARAFEAGIKSLMPRSRFVQELPGLLKSR